MTADELNPESGLVVLAKAGDRAAFEELIRRTARLVFAKLVLETGNRQRAEDLTQETYLLAFRNLHQLAADTSFRPWLLGIAHRALLDAVRRDQRRKRSGTIVGDTPLTLVASSDPDPADEASRQESRSSVLQALRSLPEQYRLPLSLRYLAGADYETIGMQLGLTNGSLHGLLQRGLKLLRERLPHTLVEPESRSGSMP